MTIGIDIYQENGAIDWSRAVSSGHLGLVGVRATFGTTPDKEYYRYVSELDARGIPHFAYGFLRFGSGAPSPEDQAKALLEVAGPEDDYTLTPAIDLEFGGKRPPGVSAGEALDWFLRCFTTVKAALGGADPGVYTSNVVWIDPDGMNNLPCPELAGAWSWMKYWPFPVGSKAVYDPIAVANLSAPAVAPPFHQNWNLQQYQGDCVGYPGVTTKVDMNRVHAVKQNDRGGTVAWVQNKLRITADGIFGSATDAAVRAFQSARNLTPDGIVGLKTTACLSRVA